MKTYAKNPAELIVLGNPHKTVTKTKKSKPKSRRNPSSFNTSNLLDSMIDGAVVVGGLLAGTQAAKFVSDLIPPANDTFKKLAAIGIPLAGGTILLMGGNTRIQKMGVGMAGAGVLSALKMIAPKLAFIPVAGEIIDAAVSEIPGFVPGAVAMAHQQLSGAEQQYLPAGQPLVALADSGASGLLEEVDYQTM